MTQRTRYNPSSQHAVYLLMKTVGLRLGGLFTAPGNGRQPCIHLQGAVRLYTVVRLVGKTPVNWCMKIITFATTLILHFVNTAFPT